MGSSISNICAALKECRRLEWGEEIHRTAMAAGFEANVYVASSLVSMYSKCGSLARARNVFEAMEQSSVVPWNALMFGYAENGEGDQVPPLLARLLWEGTAPSALTFVAALKACSNLASSERKHHGCAIHFHVEAFGYSSDIRVENTLVNMYGKCGCMPEAYRVFSGMLCRNVVSWNILLFAYAENGEGQSALELFACMLREGCSPDELTYVATLKACSSLAAKEEGKACDYDGKRIKVGSWRKGRAIHQCLCSSNCDSSTMVGNTLIDMYGKCGATGDARRVFGCIPQPDTVSWNAIMLGYAENGEGNKTLELYATMGLEPDSYSFAAVLQACGLLVALQLGRSIHSQLVRLRLDDNAVSGTCLIDFYSKCGSMADAERVFTSLGTSDVVCWTALMAGYSRQGDTNKVFQLFDQMLHRRLRPNAVTLLSLLCACSHAGLVDEGRGVFRSMETIYGVAPSLEHYVCMIDLLGRANQLEEAVALLRKMPFKATAAAWRSLLAACRKWKNAELGKVAFQSLLELDDHEHLDTAYILMSNIFSQSDNHPEHESNASGCTKEDTEEL